MQFAGRQILTTMGTASLTEDRALAGITGGLIIITGRVINPWSFSMRIVSDRHICNCLNFRSDVSRFSHSYSGLIPLDEGAAESPLKVGDLPPSSLPPIQKSTPG